MEAFDVIVIGAGPGGYDASSENDQPGKPRREMPTNMAIALF